MFSIELKRPRVTLALVAGLLAVAGPAGASASAPAGSHSDRVHSGPSAVGIMPISPDNDLNLAMSRIVTDNKDPDKL
jgi:hypothetical protein